MNIKKKCSLFIIFIMALNIFGPNIFANDNSYDYISKSVVSSVTRVEISNGLIVGEKAEYFFIVPKDIRDSLVVDREAAIGPMKELERLNFYCASYSKKYKPAFLMSLYIFEKAQWNDSLDLKIVLKSKDYVFAADIGYDDSFTQSQDRVFYNYCKTYLGSSESINNLISLPKSQLNPFDDAVFINGKTIDEKVEVVDGVYYVPLRAALEQMNYTVGWSSKRNIVEIGKDRFRDSFKILEGKYIGKGYDIVVIADRTYISTSYFFKVLEASVEIDESNNVYIIAG